MGIREVAKRFGCGQNDIRQALEVYGMDRPSMTKIRRSFDVSFAELDIKVAPEGIDRSTVARERYDEFIEVGLEHGLFETPPTLELLIPPVDPEEEARAAAEAAEAAEAEARKAEAGGDEADDEAIDDEAIDDEAEFEDEESEENAEDDSEEDDKEDETAEPLEEE
jgi:hypothetical protein